MPGPLGTATNSPSVDSGTMALMATPTPGPAGADVITTASAESALPPVKPLTDDDYIPGVAHNHKPSGQWKAIQANPDTLDDNVRRACEVMNPSQMAATAIAFELRDKPIALAHFNYYVAGSGADYDENENIEKWITTDIGAQIKIAKRLPKMRTGNVRDDFMFKQKYYKQVDFKDAFGGIDHLSFEADFARGTLRVWFKDRYEWHPQYPNLYPKKKTDYDDIRGTNCFHAAMVEMKAPPHHAADFWMKGEATVPLSVVLAGAANNKDDVDD